MTPNILRLPAVPDSLPGQMFCVVIVYADASEEVAIDGLTEEQAGAYCDGFNCNRRRKRMAGVVRRMEGGAA